MDRWTKWQMEVNADLQIIKSTLEKGGEAVQARFQTVQDAIQSVQIGMDHLKANLSDLQVEVARQDVAVPEALGKLGARFNEVAETFQDYDARFEEIEVWRREVDRKLAS